MRFGQGWARNQSITSPKTQDTHYFSTIYYTYNALGQQVEHLNAGNRWILTYHSWGEKNGWYNGIGNGWQRYLLFVHGRETRIYTTNMRYYAHANHLGSSAMWTSETGAAVGEHLYYPWGDRWATSGTSFSPQFAAFRDTVESTGDIYVTPNRHYFPTTFRWMSPDKLAGDIMNPQSLNRYGYVLGNPANLTDPSGLCAEGLSEYDCAWQDYGDYVVRVMSSSLVDAETIMALTDAMKGAARFE